jgi:hypothetical protein
MDTDTQAERRRGRPRKPFDMERAVQLRDSGYSLRAIAAELGVATMKVQRELDSPAPPLLRTTRGLKLG